MLNGKTQQLIERLASLENEKDFICDAIEIANSELIKLHGPCKLCFNHHFPHCIKKPSEVSP